MFVCVCVCVCVCVYECACRSTFPPANRLILGSREDLKSILVKFRNRNLSRALADFHLLYFLSTHLELESDIALLIDCVVNMGEVQEGYRLILESIAGM